MNIRCPKCGLPITVERGRPFPSRDPGYYKIVCEDYGDCMYETPECDTPEEAWELYNQDMEKKECSHE
jgi:hypothetical protein